MKVHDSILFSWNSDYGTSEFSTLNYAPGIFPDAIAIKSSKTGNIEIFEHHCWPSSNFEYVVIYFPKNKNLKNKNGDLYKIVIFND